MTFKIFIPIDSTALSLGANDVYEAVISEAKKRDIDIQIVRNGSRGLFWLEPLIEVETSDGRLAYGPVTVDDVITLFDDKFYAGNDSSSLFLGLTEEIAWLKNQERLTFARVGITDPVDIDDYEKYDGFKGLRNALKEDSQSIVKTMTDSGLRGRGGAAFPTGIKWQTVLDAPSETKRSEERRVGKEGRSRWSPDQ